MPLLVRLTDSATRDLEGIWDYIYQHDAAGSANHVLGQIESAFSSLAEFPERGSHVTELLQIGILGCLEIFLKPYRIIYRVTADTTYSQSLMGDVRCRDCYSAACCKTKHRLSRQNQSETRVLRQLSRNTHGLAS